MSESRKIGGDLTDDNAWVDLAKAEDAQRLMIQFVVAGDRSEGSEKEARRNDDRGVTGFFFWEGVGVGGGGGGGRERERERERKRESYGLTCAAGGFGPGVGLTEDSRERAVRDGGGGGYVSKVVRQDGSRDLRYQPEDMRQDTRGRGEQDREEGEIKQTADAGPQSRVSSLLLRDG